MLKLSTGLRNNMLAVAGFKQSMDSSVLRIYAGAEPADADADASGNTLICIIYNGNDGLTPLTFEAAAANGEIQKLNSENWAGTNSTSDTATFYRLLKPADADGASTTEFRVQGSIGTAGKELNLSSVALVNLATQDIDYYSIALPTL